MYRKSILLLFFLIFSPLHGKDTLYKTCVSDTHKIVYFRNQKCGNSTIRHLLETYADGVSKPKAIPFDSEKYADYYKFSIVRNPWDRIVSCYCHKIVGKRHRGNIFEDCYGRDFEFFVRFIETQDLATTNRHIRQQTHLIALDEVDYIGRFEDLTDEIYTLFNSIGIDELEIPHVHHTPREHPHYSQYYTDELRDIIARKYKEDIENFGYEFEDLR